MKEQDVTLCGHGSGTPSTKNMYTYMESRYQQKAGNGIRKGVVAVRRLKKLDAEGRKAFRAKYKTILGRNAYKQSLRTYVYTKYKDGKYYSDCSASGMATFREIGYNVTLLNTAGIYTSSLFEDVPVKIKNGHITNPEILQVGDAILFVGNDPSRPKQIGHVEYVYDLPARYEPGTYTLNHGSYLRSAPGGDKTKLDKLTASLKEKCSNEKGYAMLKKGTRFSLIDAKTDNDGNVWALIKSGYWIAVYYDGKSRI